MCRPQNILGEEILVCREADAGRIAGGAGAGAGIVRGRGSAASAKAGQAAQLLAAGFQFDPTEFGLRDNDAEGAQAEEAREEFGGGGGEAGFV